jgi:Peptidase S46
MFKRAVLLILTALLLAGAATADEGMWLFNAFPAARVKAKYGFEPTQEWLDHVRLSSVRFNNGGSGSYVSSTGLTFTNHHVGAVCVQQLSTGGKDFMKQGFYAKTQAEEARCPDLELNVLQSIEDVTAQVQDAVKANMSAAEAGTAQRSAMSAIESECAKSTGLRCDVVTLYAGGLYNLYRYKKYTDVRLVFAPEFDAAFFGGDADNFEYPRYDLDITFFRVYENDKPAQLTNYFKWSKAGVSDGELIFVSGNPGSTGRLLTTSQLEFLRDTSYSWRLQNLKELIQALKAYSGQSAENARRAQEDIFGMENSLKAITGYRSGLLDQKLMATKQQAENKLKQDVAGDAKKKQQFGDPWADTAQAEATYQQIFLPLTYVERRAGFRGDLPGFARILVRAAVEKQKPSGQRLREYRESALASLEQQLFSTAPIYKDEETVLLTESLRQMQRDLKSDPVVAKVLNGQDPAQAAKTLIEGSKLDDVAVRKQLYEGGQAAVTASTDPLIILMRNIDPEARKYRTQYDDEVESVERRSGATLSKIRFAELGTNFYPDATFTLRLSYGAVKGYTEDGRGSVVPAGTKLPYFTNFAGAFEHAAKHNNQPPYKLPASWMQNKSKINLQTPLNAIETADIIGGNSGSPVVNKAGDVVGIIFDGNIQSLPWNFQYEDGIGRSLHVDSRGILEALRHIYGATRVADELEGKTAAASAGAAKK